MYRKDEKYHIVCHPRFSELTFQLGKPFMEKTMDGRNVEVSCCGLRVALWFTPLLFQSIFALRENVLMQTQTDIKTKLKTTTDYVFQDNKLTVVSKFPISLPMKLELDSFCFSIYENLHFLFVLQLFHCHDVTSTRTFIKEDSRNVATTSEPRSKDDRKANSCDLGRSDLGPHRSAVQYVF